MEVAVTGSPSDALPEPAAPEAPAHAGGGGAEVGGGSPEAGAGESKHATTNGSGAEDAATAGGGHFPRLGPPGGFFPEYKISYEGPDSHNLLAFKYYNADEASLAAPVFSTWHNPLFPL